MRRVVVSESDINNMHYCQNDVIEKLDHFPSLSILPYPIQKVYSYS
jgi:hypothetical protein